MTFDALVSVLRACGATIRVSNDTIHCTLPTDVDTIHLGNALEEHKQKLVSVMTGGSSGTKKGGFTAIQCADTLCDLNKTQLRLTTSQTRFWEEKPDSSWTPKPFLFRIQGNLDAPRLSAAIDKVAIQHAALRTKFNVLGRTVTQSMDGIIPQLTRVDLSRDARISMDQSNALSEIIHREQAQQFELDTGRVAYFTLYKLGIQDYVLSLNVHHIVFDGWSLRLVCDAISAHYAHIENDPELLETLIEPLGYSAYALWEDEWMRSDEYRLRKSRWLDYYSHPTVPSSFLWHEPSRRNGALISLPISTKTLRNVERAAAKWQTTISDMCLAAFSIVLQKYCGINDMLIGCLTANRIDPKWDRVVGCFADYQLAPMHLNADGDLMDAISQAKSFTEFARKNAGVPSSVILASDIATTAPSIPIRFRFTYNYLFTGFPAPKFENCKADFLEWDYTHSESQFALMVLPRESGIQLFANFDRTRLSDGDASSILRRIVELLECDRW